MYASEPGTSKKKYSLERVLRFEHRSNFTSELKVACWFMLINIPVSEKNNEYFFLRHCASVLFNTLLEPIVIEI